MLSFCILVQFSTKQPHPFCSLRASKKHNEIKSSGYDDTANYQLEVRRGLCNRKLGMKFYVDPSWKNVAHHGRSSSANNGKNGFQVCNHQGNEKLKARKVQVRQLKRKGAESSFRICFLCFLISGAFCPEKPFYSFHRVKRHRA